MLDYTEKLLNDSYYFLEDHSSYSRKEINSILDFLIDYEYAETKKAEIKIITDLQNIIIGKKVINLNLFKVKNKHISSSFINKYNLKRQTSLIIRSILSELKSIKDRENLITLVFRNK